MGTELSLSRLERPLPANEKTGFTSLSIIGEVGAALATLSGFVRGRPISMLPEFDLALFSTEYAKNPNRAFQKMASPLFPIANRLRDPSCEARAEVDPFAPTGSATLLGCDVRFPLNNRGAEGAPAHHLHGTLFRRPSDSVKVTSGLSETVSISTFTASRTKDWAEGAEITVRHALVQGKYRYEIGVENRGELPIPIGFGAHPYFQLPSRDPKGARLFLPAERVAVVDNLVNVFPTGRWTAVPGTRFDFGSLSPLPEGAFDHFFLFHPSGPRKLELHDTVAGVAYRMVALSPNIIGAQFYYPGAGSVFALELVTHFPDPRQAVWGQEQTGLRRLLPGEKETYAFEIEVFAI